MQERIIKLHNDMEKLTIEAGIPKEKYSSIIMNLDEFANGEIENLLCWLETTYNNEYKEVKRIWSWLSDEIWERYKTFNIKGLDEQIKLAEAQRKLRRRWLKPYRTEKQLQRIRNKKNPVKIEKGLINE